MVPAHFHDATDDKIWCKRGPHLNHSFMSSAMGNSYLSRRTYPDTSVELVEDCVALTGYEHVQNIYFCNS